MEPRGAPSVAVRQAVAVRQETYRRTAVAVRQETYRRTLRACPINLTDGRDVRCYQEIKIEDVYHNTIKNEPIQGTIIDMMHKACSTAAAGERTVQEQELYQPHRYQ